MRRRQLAMNYSEDLIESRRLLEFDPLRHIVALKAITNNISTVRVILVHGRGDWGLLTILPTRVSQWHRINYPDSELIVLVDGNNTDHELTLLDEIPAANAVIKTSDRGVMADLQKRGAIKTTSFISFTIDGNDRGAKKDNEVEMSSKLSPEARSILAQTGYSNGELSKHFANGAVWFGLRQDRNLVSICFVYQNYDYIWEIGGVCTASEYRRKGYAKLCIEAAIRHMLANEKYIRYQVCESNTASLELAKSAGLIEFLRLYHYMIEA